MLIKIAIKNFIIIKQLDIDFESGLNVLTGETGAGKSIILGAIRLSLGERSTGNPVRAGADKAIVQTVFTLNGHPTLSSEYEDDQIIFTRELHTSGRSILKINGEVVTLSQARILSEKLLTIHGQNDFQSILEPKGQLALIDAFLDEQGMRTKKQTYAFAKELQDIESKRKTLNLSPESIEREIERIRFQMDDIDNANLAEDDELIESKYKKMSQAKSYIDIAQRAGNLVDSDDMESTTINAMLSRLIGDAEILLDIEPSLRETIEQLNDISFNLGEISGKFNKLIDSLLFEPQDLINAEKRLDTVNQLKKKYGNTIDIIGDYRLSLNRELEILNKQSLLRENLDKAYKTALSSYNKAADKLTNLRQKAALVFQTSLTKSLSDLKFDDVNINTDFKMQDKPKITGADKVNILISLNKGMPLSPLKTAASGGEISRIMLAIKEIMAEKDKVNTLVFDEIDSGISGETASVVADKLKRVSKYHQVILISHLAQVALLADRHFKIEKSANDKQTISNVISLNDEQRAHEIARIMGGLNIDDNLLQQARVLIDKSKNR